MTASHPLAGSAKFGDDMLLDCPDLHVTDVTIEADAVTIHVESTVIVASCPHCGGRASRIHSHYTRTLTDLPICGRRTTLLVTARRFFCDDPNCPRTLFCERFPQLAEAHARTT